jgi:hypothetical protein
MLQFREARKIERRPEAKSYELKAKSYELKAKSYELKAKS